jgi:hypothetical protein
LHMCGVGVTISGDMRWIEGKGRERERQKHMPPERRSTVAN